jgi:uncharacterized protein
VTTVRRFEDPRDFRRAVDPFLMRDEARHNLQLGICGRLEVDAHAFGDEDPYLAAVEDGADVVGIAIRTPPFNLLLSSSDPSVVDVLAEDVAGRFPSLPGVNAEPALSARFAHAWRERSGQPAHSGLSTRIHQLTQVPDVPPASGRFRPATVDDRALLIEWFEAFAAEAHPGPEVEASRTVDLRLSGTDGAIVLWEDDEPVSFSAHGGATPNGIRIGPVYTPPEQRGRGYAGACVATQSAQLLNAGHRFCFLFTDLANPVSNRLYQRIGYEPVCDMQEIRFGEPDPSV